MPCSRASLVLPDLKQPPHTCKLCVTPTNSKWDKTLFSDMSQDKDLEETGGKGKRDAEPRPRSTPQLCPPSVLGYSITPESSTQRHWVESCGWTFRRRPSSTDLVVSLENIIAVVIPAENHRPRPALTLVRPSPTSVNGFAPICCGAMFLLLCGRVEKDVQQPSSSQTSTARSSSPCSGFLWDIPTLSVNRNQEVNQGFP